MSGIFLPKFLKKKGGKANDKRYQWKGPYLFNMAIASIILCDMLNIHTYLISS